VNLLKNGIQLWKSAGYVFINQQVDLIFLLFELLEQSWV